MSDSVGGMVRLGVGYDESSRRSGDSMRKRFEVGYRPIDWKGDLDGAIQGDQK